MEVTSYSLVATLGFGLFFLLMLFRMPIALAFAFVGFCGLAYMTNFHAAMSGAITEVWATFMSTDLMAVPLFIMMGILAHHSDIGPDLYRAVSKWFGRLPGGLAIATTWGCALFSAITGSSAAGILTFSPICYGPMSDYGYSKRLTSGTICSAATMGILIPPSIPFVIYGTITEESVGRLFIAGIIPGLLQALMYSALIILFAGLGIWEGPPGPRSTWKEKFMSLTGVWGMLVLFIIVIGGLYMGILTPTEGAAVGALGALVIMLSRKGFQYPTMKIVVAETVRTSCMAYTILAGSMIFSKFIALTNLNQALSNYILSLHVHPLIIVSAILVGYIILGFPMPAIPMLVLTVPTLYPVITSSLGLDGIWFGVLVVLMVEIANISPPVGINLFIMQGLYKKEELPLGDLYRGVMPFLLIDVVRVVLLVAFPTLILWLPGRMYGTV